MDQFGDRQLMVKKLREKGFSVEQIQAMAYVIMNVRTRFDDILADFNPSMSVEEIDSYLEAS